MDILQQEVRGIALSTISTDPHAPVYGATTVPLNRKDSRNLDQAMVFNNTSHGHNNNNGHCQSHNDIEAHHIRTFQNLPSCEPVDIQFKDVSYCVNMGFRKG